MNPEFKIQQSIDTCGTRCPIPLLRAKQALKSMSDGEYLQVLSTDPSAKADFDAMLKHLPHDLVQYQTTEPSAGKYKRIDIFIIRKGQV